MKEEVNDLKLKLNKTLNLIENDINMRSMSTMYNQSSGFYEHRK